MGERERERLLRPPFLFEKSGETMGSNVVGDGGYSSLKDIKLDFINKEGDVNGAFVLCFWLYLSPKDSTPFPSTLLQQHHPDMTSNAPFLVLNKKKELMLYPMLFRHQEAPSPSNLTDWLEIASARTEIAVAFNKWVHVGCEVSTDIVRLYIDGEIVGEMRVSCTFAKDSQEDGLEKVSLVGADGEDSIEGYVHSMEILHLTSAIKDHFLKEPPVQLQIDGSSATDIEEDSDGVWSVLGGKASCRRNFSLDVVLMDAFGRTVDKDMEVVASLTYADNETLVEKPDDAEAPLLTSYDGIEFASWDRPSKLVKGRASFKLKISQCDNRLFRIKFDIPKMGRYPFLDVFSRSIRCVSRNSNTRPSTLIWKRSTSSMHVLNGTSGLDDGSMELVHNIVQEAKPSPPSKRIKLGQAQPFVIVKSDNSIKRDDEEGNSHAGTDNEDVRLNGRALEGRPEMRGGGSDVRLNSSSDSDSSEATNSCKSMGSNGSPISDLNVFRYCLGDLTEKSLLLKDIAIRASKKELVDFAQQVSQFSGCLHHWNQIRISKGLIEEGMNAWNLISQNKYHVLWDNIILVLKEQFTKIACSQNRLLAQQDFEVLRRIGGCQELVGQENFEKVWCWLYPVAFALSHDRLNELWNSRWIEGLITKEEAESSLQGPHGLQDPGTFVLRFPTSRSWPHPDAGNLIVTYVGSDYVIHHRLLSLDSIYGSDAEEISVKSLKDMLLEEHELSRLGRIARSFRLA